MLVDPADLIAFVAAAFVVVVSPGPDTLLILRYTLSSGRRVGLATVTGLHRLDQVVGGNVFQEVPDGPRLDGWEEPLVIAEAGEDDDLCGGAQGSDLACGLDTIHLGHLQVHEHHIGQEAADLLYAPRSSGTRPSLIA